MWREWFRRLLILHRKPNLLAALRSLGRRVEERLVRIHIAEDTGKEPIGCMALTVVVLYRTASHLWYIVYRICGRKIKVHSDVFSSSG
jgi:hypothetical protein